MRKTPFSDGEIYHVYNRGTDKRSIFSDRADVDRFFTSMKEFNTLDPIGSLYELSFEERKLGGSTSKPLVNFICYCLNPNHYHFLLEQVVEKGIEKFMQRLGTGYTLYFNTRHKRSGALFQGRFKSKHVESNDYLLRLSSYINLNSHVHQHGGSNTKLVR